MEGLSTKGQWGLAAILGCGLCCGGLLGNAAWLGATAVTLGSFVAGAVWLGLAAAGLALALLIWQVRRRRRASCAPAA